MPNETKTIRNKGQREIVVEGDYVFKPNASVSFPTAIADRLLLLFADEVEDVAAVTSQFKTEVYAPEPTAQDGLDPNKPKTERKPRAPAVKKSAEGTTETPKVDPAAETAAAQAGIDSRVDAVMDALEADDFEVDGDGETAIYKMFKNKELLNEGTLVDLEKVVSEKVPV